MIRQLFIQLVKKKKRFYVSAIVLLLVFFVFVILANFVFVNLYKSFFPQLPVEINNRLVLNLDWNYDKRKQMPSGFENQFCQQVLSLNDVIAADFSFSDPLNVFDITLGNMYNDREALIFCGPEFGKVFDLKLASGRWFIANDKAMKYPPAVITVQHARTLGINTIEKNLNYTFVDKLQTKDSFCYEIVGIIENIPDMIQNTGIEKGAFPVFVPTYSRKLDIPVHSLLIKVRPGYDFDVLQRKLVTLLQKSGFNEYLFGYEIHSLEDLIKEQISNHFTRYKLLYGILLILISYILVALFGNFWNQTTKRIEEIGIRRALGHSRGKVVFYILAESLLLLAIVMLPATIVYLNLYKILNITAPLPVYLISTGMLLFIVLLATLVPAIRAGRIHPVEALAEE